MKRLAVVFAIVTALPVFAQEKATSNIKAPAAQGVEVYGDFFIRTFGRSGALNRALDREKIGGADTDSDTGSFLTARIGLKLMLEKRVSVNLELENRELERGEDDLDFDVRFGQAFVEVRDMFVTGLSFRAGIQNFTVDPAGTGHPFFMDLRRSESPFWTTVQEAQLTQGNAAARLDGFASSTGLIKDRQYDAGGFRIAYALNENVEVSGFWFTTWEGGPAHDDQWLYGARFDMNFLDKDRPSTLVLLASVFSNDGNNHRVFTFGGGTGIRVKDFTFHAEGYGQAGEYGEFDSGTEEDVQRQEGWAGIVGAYYRPEVDPKESKFLIPFFSVSARAMSGDNGENTIFGTSGNDARSRTNRDFLSMEGNNELIVLEDDVLGLDVDSNYWSVRAGGGVRLSLLEPGDFEIGVTWAYSRLMKRVDFDIRGADSWKTLGHEVDAKVVWHQSELVKFGTGFGVLWHSDFFGTRSRSVDDLGFRIDTRTMWIWTFDVSVTF